MADPQIGSPSTSQWYTSPYGVKFYAPTYNTNYATQIRLPDGTLHNVQHNADGTTTYVPAPTTGTTPGQGTQLPGDQASAKATLDQTLATFGLQSLGDKLWQEYKDGVPLDQIYLDMRQTAEYKARFPAMSKLSSEGRAISEAQYVNFEQSAYSIWHQAGLNPDMVKQGDYITKWLEGDVSLAEVQHRVQDLYVKVADSDPAIRQWYAQKFGASGDAALAASFADPQTATPVLERQAAAAVFGGTGTVFGYNIDLAMADRAANAGVSQAQAQQGFQQLQGLNPLFQETISENHDLTAEQQGAEAVFALGGHGQQDLQLREAERKAAFGGSTQAGALATQQGLELGSATSNS